MNEARLQDLLDNHLDGCLDEAGRAELEAALAESADARRAYWDCAGQHAALRELLLEERGRRLAVAGSSRRVVRVRSGKSRLFWTIAGAAAATLLVVAGLRLASPSSKLAGPLVVANATAAPLVRELADGTRLTLYPGARVLALGRDASRGVRQLLRLESRGVEIQAPPAAAGEIACRVETPDGLWVETKGTTFRVERAFQDESGARTAAAPAPNAVLAAILVVNVTEGQVLAGLGATPEAEVAAGGSAEIKALAEHFKRRRAHWLKIAQEDERRRDPAEMLELAHTWIELGDWEEARGACRRLLERFDPDGDVAGTPDKELPDVGRLSAAIGGADFPTVEMVRLGKEKLDGIRKAFFGDPGADPRPPGDYPRAIRAIDAFLKGFPRYGLDEAGSAGDCRRGLEALRGEAELRCILLAAMSDLAESCLELGLPERAAGREDEALAFFGEGAKVAERVAQHLPRDPELAYVQASCLLALGASGNDRPDLERAMDLFRRLRASGGERPDLLWWKATRGLVDALVALDRREEARGIVHPLVLSVDRQTVERYWPELPKTAKALGL